MGEKSVQEGFLGEESVGDKYMGEKYVQEGFLGEESVGESLWVKSLCKKGFWVKSLWVTNIGEHRDRWGMLASVPPFSGDIYNLL